MLLVLLTTATFVTNNKLFLKMQFCQNFTVLFLFCTWCPSFCYSANSISQVLTHIIYKYCTEVASMSAEIISLIVVS